MLHEVENVTENAARMDFTMGTGTPKGFMTLIFKQREVSSFSKPRRTEWTTFPFASFSTCSLIGPSCANILPQRKQGHETGNSARQQGLQIFFEIIAQTHLKLAYLYLHMYTIFFLKDICKLNDSWRMHTICQELWLQATVFVRWACIMFTRHIVLHALDIISRFKTSQIKIKL